MPLHTWLQHARRPRYRTGTLRYSAFGLAAVMLWLLIGELGMTMRDRALMPANLEMLRRYGASDHQVSVLLAAIPSALTLLMSPLIGPASDRLRSRWGRRRPFLFVLAPLGGLALLGLAGSAQIGAWSAALYGGDPRSHALAVFAVCWVLFAGLTLCVQALYTALVNDVLPRAWLGRFFGLYRIVSLSVGIAFYLWLFPALDAHLHAIVATVGVLYAVLLMLMCVLVREGRYPPAPPEPSSAPARLRALVAQGLALRHGGWIYAALILGGLSFGPFNTFSQYHAEALGVSKTALGELTSIGYAISIALAMLIGAMVDRFGALRMALGLMALYALGVGIGFWRLQGGTGFAPVYLLHVVLSGAYFTAAASLPMALLPRLNFLRYCAMKDLLGSLVNIGVSSVQGAVLDRAGHDYRLALLFGALCAGATVLCLARLARSGLGQPAATP